MSNPVLWLAVAAAVGCLIVWLVGGTVGTRLARRRDRREADLDLSLIDRNICPIHTDKPADGSGCTCTWLLPWSYEHEQAATEQAWQRAARAVEITQLDQPETIGQLRDRLTPGVPTIAYGYEITLIPQPPSEATDLDTYPAWRRRLDQRRAETKPATDEEYYAGDSKRFGDKP